MCAFSTIDSHVVSVVLNFPHRAVFHLLNSHLYPLSTPSVWVPANVQWFRANKDFGAAAIELTMLNNIELFSRIVCFQARLFLKLP